MPRPLLKLVLKHADGLTPADTDAHLLRRFVATRCEQAFAAIVKRHGPMVWAVCRQSVPNRADAEDVFQATFLALSTSAGRVRTHLAGWLYAAAVRIAAKAKRGYARRRAHERATARPEGDSPVAAAAWADLLAAVHAEVATLPPSLRAAFALCDLQGVDPAAAAAQLGVKPNSLTGQLARARQRLVAALAKRGIAAGAVAFGAAGGMPEVQAAGGAVPSAAVLELASEVTTVGIRKLKLLAAGLMLAGGLTVSGLGLLPRADGQYVPPGFDKKPGTTLPLTPIADKPPGGLPPGSDGAPPTPASGGLPPGSTSGAPPMSGTVPAAELPPTATGAAPRTGGTAPPAAFDYLFAGKPGTVADVARLLRAKAADGWEYTGPLDVDPADPPKGTAFEGVAKDTRVVLVFKKRTGGTMTTGGGGRVPAPGGSPMPGSGGSSAGGGYDGGRSGTPPSAGPSSGGPLPTIDGRPNVPGTGKGIAPGPGASGGSKVPEPSAGGGDGPEAAERFEVVKLKNASADEVASVLAEVFNGPNKWPARVRVVADKKSNQIIVVKASDTDLKAILKLLDTLDVGPKPGK